MQRIDPELVISAYRVTGLRPVKHTWGSTKDGSACALSAVCVAAEAGHPGDAAYCAHPTICELLALDPVYVASYVLGFDGNPPPRHLRGDQLALDGYADGAAAAALVFGAEAR